MQRAPGGGADSQIRTGDLILTKDALYRLSYISMLSFDNDGMIPQEKCFCKQFFANMLFSFCEAESLDRKGTGEYYGQQATGKIIFAAIRMTDRGTRN